MLASTPLARPASSDESRPDGAPAPRARRARQSESAEERRARIERLRVQLQNGTYRADAVQIADALVASGDLEP